MEISGFKKRKIYEQTGFFAWRSNISINENCSYFDFGFSGQSGVLNWSLKNSKIYDNLGNNVGSYASNQVVELSGNVGPVSNDFFINNAPVYIGQPKQSNNYSYFYFNTDQASKSYVDFFVEGDYPTGYESTGYGQKAYSSSGTFFEQGLTPIQLKLNNPNPLDIFIYSGQVNDSNFSFKDSPAQFPREIVSSSEEIFEIVPINFVRGDYSFPVVFNTNFGDFSYTFQASGIPLSEQSFYLLISPNNTTISNDEINRYSSYFLNTSGSDFKISLEYISGFTGSVFFDIARDRLLEQQLVSGFVSGSGNLSAYKTGSVSGFNSILNQYEFGSGSGNVFFKNFKATGYFEQLTEIEIPVLGSGSIQQLILGSGFAPARVSGTISRLNQTINIGGITGSLTGKNIFGENVSGYILTGDSFNSGNFTYSPSGGTYSYNANNEFTITGNYTGAELETIKFATPTTYGTGFFTFPFDNFPGFVLATGETSTGFWLGNFSYLEPGVNRIKKYISGYLMSGDSEEAQIIDISEFDPVEGDFKDGDKKNLYGYIYPKERDIKILFNACDGDFPSLDLEISELPFNTGYFKINDNNNLEVYKPFLVTGLSPENPLESYINNSNFLTKSGNFYGKLDFYNESGLFVGDLDIGTSTPTGGRVRISRLYPSISGSGFFNNPIQSFFSSSPTPVSTGGLTGSKVELNSLDGWREYMNSYPVLTQSFNFLSGFNVSGELFFDDISDESLVDFSIREKSCDLIKSDFKFQIKKEDCYVDFDLFKESKYCKNYNTTPSQVVDYSFNEPIGTFLNDGYQLYLENGVSELFSNSTLVKNCVGVGCTGLGNYISYVTGISGCSPNELYFTGFYSGVVQRRYVFASTGYIKKYFDGTEIDTEEFCYQNLAFGVNKIPLGGGFTTTTGQNGELIGGFIINPPNYDRDVEGTYIDYDYPPVAYGCYGSGCRIFTGKMYSGEYSYNVNENTGIGGSFSGIFKNYILEQGLYSYSGESRVIEETTKKRVDFGYVFDCDEERYILKNFNENPEYEYFGKNSKNFYGVSGNYLLNNNYELRTGDCFEGGCTGGYGYYYGYSLQLADDENFYGEIITNFQGYNYDANDISGISKGNISFFNCSGYDTRNEKVKTLKSGPFSNEQIQQKNNFFSFSDYLASGNYLLKIKYGQPTGGFNPPSEPLPSYLSFSKTSYSGCEKDQMVSYTINLTGWRDYDFSGLISYQKWAPTINGTGAEYLESNEIYPSGYFTKVPFIINNAETGLKLGQILENEGDMEKVEGFKLKITPIGSYPFLQIDNDEANFIITDDDINETYDCTPSEPPLPPDSIAPCCLPTLCVETTQEQCSRLGGKFLTGGLRCHPGICDDIPFTPPTGPAAAAAAVVGPAAAVVGPAAAVVGPAAAVAGPVVLLAAPASASPPGPVYVGPGGANAAPGAPKTGPSVQKGCYIELVLSCWSDNSDCLAYGIYGVCSVTAVPKPPSGKSLSVDSCDTCALCKARSMNKRIYIDDNSVFDLDPYDSKTFDVFKFRNLSAIVTDDECKNGGVGSESELTAAIRVRCFDCDAADAYASFSSDCCSQELWTDEVQTTELCPDGVSEKKKKCHQLCSRTEEDCVEPLKLPIKVYRTGGLSFNYPFNGYKCVGCYTGSSNWIFQGEITTRTGNGSSVDITCTIGNAVNSREGIGVDAEGKVLTYLNSTTEYLTITYQDCLNGVFNSTQDWCGY